MATHVAGGTEVGNVTSKRNGVTRYRFSNALRAISIRSNNDFYEPRAIIKRGDNFSPQLFNNSKPNIALSL
jgi:hypothetical protein